MGPLSDHTIPGISPKSQARCPSIKINGSASGVCIKYLKIVEKRVFILGFSVMTLFDSDKRIDLLWVQIKKQKPLIKR